MKLPLLALIIFALLVFQATSDRDVLQPPRQGLVALHWPDITNLEPGVREQLATSQASLIAAVKQPALTDAALSEAYGELGQVYHAYSLTSPARECYLNASHLTRSDFRWIYLLGKLDQQEGRFDDAIRRYESVRILKPDYVAARVNLGNILLELDRLDAAAENFQTALAIDKDDPAAHYGLGQVVMSRRNYTEAVKYFERTLALVPGASRVHYSLAMAYRALGETDKAKAHLAQQGTVGVRVIDPLVDGLQHLITGERVYLARGKRAFEAQRYADAAAEFQKAIAASPNSVTARVNLGATLTQLGDLAGAAKQFQEAIRIDQRNVNAHYNLAVILARQDKHEEAITHVRTALSVDPGDLNARVLLAQELVKVGHFDDALAEFSLVVETNPNNEGALLDQVKLLHRKGQFKRALAAIEKGHAAYPQKGRTALVLAYLLTKSPELQLRNGQRALELAQSIYKATGAVQHAVLVAMALAELGRCNESLEWQRRAVVSAEGQDNAEQLAKVRADLKLYDGAQTCRPVGDALLTELPFFEKSR